MSDSLGGRMLESWGDFYRSDLQGVYSLLVMPFAFLVYRTVASPSYAGSVNPAAARFVDLYTLVFALETMLDPIATGPMLSALGWKDATAGEVVSFVFVYLGDFRVLALIFGVALAEAGLGSALGRAALWSLIVPIVAWGSYGLLGLLFEDLPRQVLWFVYEVGFLSLALYLSRGWIEARRTSLRPETVALLKDALGFAAAYYALWASADVLITFAGLDPGWAIRIVPNQLYYAAWVPFVYIRFFGFGPPRSS